MSESADEDKEIVLLNKISTGGKVTKIKIAPLGAILILYKKIRTEALGLRPRGFDDAYKSLGSFAASSNWKSTSSRNLSIVSWSDSRIMVILIFGFFVKMIGLCVGSHPRSRTLFSTVSNRSVVPGLRN